MINCVKAYKRKPAKEAASTELVAKKEKPRKSEEPIPMWMAWLRRTFAISLLVWVLVGVWLYGLAAIMMFASHITISLAVAAYAFSRRRGIFGSVATTLLSLSIFSCLVFPPLFLFAGLPPFGISELIDDWMTRRDPYAVTNLLITVRSVLLASTSIEVFTSFLLKNEHLRKYRTKHAVKFAAICIVLFPVIVGGLSYR